MQSSTVHESRRVHVCVDQRIELMSAVQLLTDYFLVSPYQSAYRRAVQRQYGHLADHPAVAGFATLAEAGFSFDAVPHLMLTLSDPPGLRPLAPLPDDVIIRAGGQASLEAWLNHVRDFAAVSGCNQFFAAQQPLYDQLVEQVRPAAADALDALTAFLGCPLPHCTLILGLLLHHGGFAALIPREHVRPHAYALIGPVGSIMDVAVFGSAAEIAVIAWHEWSHTVINPLVDAHAEAIAQMEDRFEPIAEAMAAQAYPTWKITVIEHLVRAVTVRLTARVLGKEAGAAALADEQGRGFRYITSLDKRLAVYEAARDQYPTIDAFLPALLAAFAEA